jgi:hypothetical protein
MPEKYLKKFDFPKRRKQMAEPESGTNETEISCDRFAELLNEDLSREY